jgi:trans-aconitate methyltransferase
LGEPAQIFVDFFSRLTGEHLRVLDVGCGQGRDALLIARLGHNVVGVDVCSNGVRDLIKAASRENLPIKGVTADITAFTATGEFDVLFIDRTLHMIPKKERLETLGRLIDHVVAGGWVVIADERSNLPEFKSLFEAHLADWKIESEARGNLFLQRGSRQFGIAAGIRCTAPGWLFRVLAV